MKITDTLRNLAALTGSCVFLTGCDLSHKIDNTPAEPDVDEVVVSVPAVAKEDKAQPELPEAVQAKVDEILEVLETKSIRRFARLASQNESFRSNYGEHSHYDNWYIQKRAGIDPIVKTKRILELPYGIRDFGSEKLYIWPELATRDVEDLKFSRLTFQERAILLDLIGQSGVDDVEGGEPYPGFRLAIREDGTWIYLLQDY